MKILFTALEKSANLHFSKVLPYLKDANFCGIYDKNILPSHPPLYDFLEFNAMGFFEVLPLVFKAKKAINELVKMAKNADVVVLIDSPAFNIPFAKALRKNGFNKKIIYFILPQVWAWKAGRIPIIEGLCDELVGILPFENQYFKKAHFFGSPLFYLTKIKKNDEISIVLNEKSLQKVYKKIIYMPGSRKGEIKRLMPEFFKLSKLLKNSNENIKNIIVVPPHLKDKTIEIYGNLDDFETCFDSQKAMMDADFAFICSGTATLEAGLIGCPFVLCYRAKWLDYHIAKALVKIKYIGLCNIIFDKLNFGIFGDEFIQNEANAQNLYKAYLNFNFDIFKNNSQKLRSLFSKDPFEKIAKLIKDEK